MATHRYTSQAAGHVQVGNNVVPVGMGDFIDLSDEDTRKKDNAFLIKEGVLVPTIATKEGDK